MLDDLAATVPCDQPWDAKDAAKLDQVTVDQWLRANTWSESVYVLGVNLVQTVLCKEATQVSLLYWLWYIHSGQGILRLADAENGAQERKFVQGACTICERLYVQLGADAVRLFGPMMTLTAEAIEVGAGAWPFVAISLPEPSEATPMNSLMSAPATKARSPEPVRRTPVMSFRSA